MYSPTSDVDLALDCLAAMLHGDIQRISYPQYFCFGEGSGTSGPTAMSLTCSHVLLYDIELDSCVRT